MTGTTRRGVVAGLVAALAAAIPVSSAPPDLDVVLRRAGEQVTGFLGQLADVRCLEEVSQEKLANGKVRETSASAYRYLLLVNSASGALTVDESREPVEPAAERRPGTSMLVSNGFAMLFLIFHPYYAFSFEFTAEGEEAVAGRTFQRVAFRHVAGKRSPAVLQLRGREYPLALSGSAWIDPRSGVIARIVATVGSTMTDVGLETLRAEEQFAPAFPDVAGQFWFPETARVEVATARQHWRNTHRFKDYRRFSVSTVEQVGVASADPGLAAPAPGRVEAPAP